ncbi:LpqB family beta-propeller domain-containing protein [Rothia sp. P7208]|uniref:LpqB family beta-propeller domain-containing protein n=1 Tax=Rothia sp. P7208 TaxID=3402660 RepID=UPI003AC46851
MKKIYSSTKVRYLGLGLCFLVGVSGCASIPQSGSVNHYADSQSTNTDTRSSIVLDPPQDGASPTEIIQGFLRAGAGAKDDYQVAREYLTEEFSNSWIPDERTLVYRDSTTLDISPDTADNDVHHGDEYSVTVPVATSIDRRGIATSYAEVSPEELKFKVVQVNGQWRIAQAPQGTVMNHHDFIQVFATYTLYFYDPTYTYAVPDIRWFADRPTVVTSITKVLLEGAAPYLEGAVSSAIPAGTTLTRNSVPVEQTVAQVSLHGDGLDADISQLDIERINSQLTQTLSLLGGIDSVKLTFDDQEVKAGSLDNYVAPQVNPSVSGNIVALDGNQLVTRSEIFNDADQQKIVDVGLASPRDLAMDYTRKNFAFLDSSQQSLFWVSDQKVTHMFDGVGLTHPSFDQFQWLWSADSTGRLRAVSYVNSQEKKQVDVRSPWLEGYDVKSVRVSRDGARAAVVATLDGETYVWVSGIHRSSDHQPLELTSPVRLGTTLDTTDVSWTSDQSLIAADEVSGKSEIIYLSGEITSVERLDSLSLIASGAGNNQIIAQTKDGRIYTLVDRGWSRIDIPLHDVSYSG